MGIALLDLFRHMEWADGEVWRAVLETPAAGDDSTLRDLLLHLHTVQHAFLDIWHERTPAFPEACDFTDMAQLRDWATPYYAEARAFVEAAAEPALARPVTMPWAAELATQLGREPEKPTLAETMFQVTSHSTYHRGQINARLRAIGGSPPLVDYIAWIWFGRPSRR